MINAPLGGGATLRVAGDGFFNQGVKGRVGGTDGFRSVRGDLAFWGVIQSGESQH